MSRRKPADPPAFVVVVEHRRHQPSKLDTVLTVVSFAVTAALILFEPRRRL